MRRAPHGIRDNVFHPPGVATIAAVSEWDHLTFCDDLIMDLGMHVGQDAEFYLKKGFRVVAVEANPILVEHARARFQSEIDAGKLSVVNLGVADQPGRALFYVNQVLSEWSSFDREIASRGHPVKEVMVETATI